MKAVLLDLDETILDRQRSLVEFANWQAQGMLKSSIQNAGEFVGRFVELDAHGSVWKDEVYAQLILEFSILDWSVDELLSSYELSFCHFCMPRKGVIEALEILHRMGRKMALVSNGKSPFQERNFEALGISEFFDAVVVSGAVGVRKPDRAIFELACESIGVKPANGIFVGDNPVSDIEGAKLAGMYAIYIPGHFGEKCGFADATCSDFRDLPGMVGAAH